MKKMILLLIAVFSLNTVSHPGRTNSEGCHNDRKNGGYHCHGKTGSSGSSKSKSKTTKKRRISSKRGATIKSTNNRIKGLRTGAAEELYFKDCKEAKKMGYSNIRKGQAGYRKELDPDGNGIACER